MARKIMARKTSAAFLALVSAMAITAAQAAPDVRNVLSSATLSFGTDGSADRAILLQNEDGQADLYIYRDVSFQTIDPKDAKPPFVKTNLVFAAGWGQQPTLSLNTKGSLVITSMNDAIGRNRWEQRLTVILRSDEFIIAGITYTSRDTLAPGAGGSCDINLLSGKGLRDGQPVEEKFKPIKLRDWSDDKLPKACAF